MSKKQTSFWIPRQAVQILLTQNASALDICAYLTLASHTDKTGMATTAGVKKIRSATGAPRGYGKSKGMAGEAVERLLRHYGDEDRRPTPKKRSGWGEGYQPDCLQRLLYTAEDYTRMTGTLFPSLPGLHEYRYVLNTFGADPLEDGVWFCREIIDGTGHFISPLKKLISGGDIAARLLLKMQEVQTRTIIDYGGVQPCNGAYSSYEGSCMNRSHGFTFWKFCRNSSTAFPGFTLPALGLNKLSEDEETKIKQLEPFWEALSFLEYTGFTEQIVTVFNADLDRPDAYPVYEVTIKNQHGHITKEDKPYIMRPRLDQLFERFGLLDEITDSRGRHEFEPVIVRAGITPHVAGVCRTRFRPSNYRQYSVKDTHLRRSECSRECMEEFEILDKLSKGAA